MSIPAACLPTCCWGAVYYTLIKAVNDYGNLVSNLQYYLDLSLSHSLHQAIKVTSIIEHSVPLCQPSWCLPPRKSCEVSGAESSENTAEGWDGLSSSAIQRRCHSLEPGHRGGLPWFPPCIGEMFMFPLGFIRWSLGNKYVVIFALTAAA